MDIFGPIIMHNPKPLLTHDLQKIEHMLLTILQDNNIPWIEEITAYAIAFKGKRLRAQLMLYLCKALEYDNTKVHHLALIIELLHAAMLLHDDIIDDAPKRRNQSSVHIAWSRNTSILMGDYIYSEVFIQLMQLAHHTITEKIASACSHIVRGELKQHSLLHNAQTTYEDYMFIIDSKTAALFAVSLECTALLIDPSKASWAHEFGMLFGRIYQMSDDLLDIQPQHATTDKKIDHDLTQGIVTLPTLLLLEKMPSEEKQCIYAMIEDSSHYDHSLYHAWLKEYDIINIMRERIRHDAQILQTMLIDNIPHNAYSQALGSIIHDMIDRTY